jgi:hypothetical protein
LDQGADQSKAIPDVIEGFGLFIGVLGPLGEVVDRTLPEAITVFTTQAA